MPSPTRHPNKEVRRAVEYAVEKGWRLKEGGSHAWGRLFCPHGQRGGCIKSTWSTPRDPEAHAKDIQAFVEDCPHQNR